METIWTGKWWFNRHIRYNGRHHTACVCVCGAQLSTANHKMSENYYENELILPCCRAGIFRNGHKNIINHSCNAHRDTSQLKHIKQWCAHSKSSATLQWIQFDWTHPIHRPKSYMLITFDIDNPILWFIFPPPYVLLCLFLFCHQINSNRIVWHLNRFIKEITGNDTKLFNELEFIYWIWNMSILRKSRAHFPLGYITNTIVVHNVTIVSQWAEKSRNFSFDAVEWVTLYHENSSTMLSFSSIHIWIMLFSYNFVLLLKSMHNLTISKRLSNKSSFCPHLLYLDQIAENIMKSIRSWDFIKNCWILRSFCGWAKCTMKKDFRNGKKN